MLRTIVLLSACLALCSGCALQSAFDDLAEDVHSGFAQLSKDAQQSREQQAQVIAQLTSEVSSIIEQKTKNLITEEEAAAQFDAAKAAAKLEVERLESERLKKAEDEAEKMELRAQLRKRESEEQQKQMVSELISAGVGVALQSPATANALKSVIEQAYGGKPVTQDQLGEALQEQGLSPELAATAAGGGSALIAMALSFLESRKRRKEIKRATNGSSDTA